MFRFLLAGIRFLLFIKISVLFILLGTVYSFFTKEKPLQILKLRKTYIKIIFIILGIKATFNNVPQKQSFILISNHRSYLDPVIIANDVLFYALAKIEVSTWPLIGVGSKLFGGFFVKREDRNSREAAAKKIMEIVQNNKIVYVCPEGTTHTEKQTIDFKPRTFINAAKHNLPIIPMAIEYEDIKDAWVGDDTFVRHFFECFGKWNTYVSISYGEEMRNDNWETLLKDAKTWIDAEMLVLRKEFGY